MADAAPIHAQTFDFAPEGWGAWSYSFGPRHLAYADGVSYCSDLPNLSDLDQRANLEARRAQLSPSARTITNAGIYVGVRAGPTGTGIADLQPLLMQPPVPLDDATSGEQAPLLACYPRVVFPATGQHRYGVVIIVDRDESATHKFGTKFEEHTVTVHRGARQNSMKIPEDCPCEQEVRRAIAEFHGHSSDIPEGDYKITIEVERLPVVSVRLDGGRPLISQLMRQGPLKSELPVMDVLAARSMIDLIFSDEPSTERASPLTRSIGRGAKYAEIPMVVPLGEGNSGGSILTAVTLRVSAGTEETAQLVYESLRRSESVAEVCSNPNLGLVEVEIGKVAKAHSIRIEYTPRAVPKSGIHRAADEFRLKSWDGGGSFGVSRSSGESGSSVPVNVGRTVLANPKIGPASPTMQAEWDGHVGTFRFCLTNEIT